MRRDDWMVLAVVLGLSAIIYSPSLRIPITGDDWLTWRWSHHLVSTMDVSALFTTSAFGPASEGGTAIYRPVSLFLFGVETLLFGTWEPGFRIVTILFFLATTVLIYAFVYRYLLPSNRTVSFIAALLYATHSAWSEVVLMTGAQEHMVAIFFGMASLVGYARYRSDTEKGTSLTNRWLWLALLMMALSIFSNELTATLPGIFVLYDLLYHWRRRAALRRLFPAWAIFAGVDAIYVAIKLSIFGKLSPYGRFGFLPQLRDLAEYLINVAQRLTIGVNVFFTVVSTYLPTFKAHPLATLPILGLWLVLPAAFVAVVIWRNRANREMWFGLLWFVIASSIMMGRFTAHRHLAWFALGLCVAAAALIVAIPSAYWRRVSYGLLAGYVLYHAAIIERHITIHREAGDLFAKVVAQTQAVLPRELERVQSPKDSVAVYYLNAPASVYDRFTNTGMYVEISNFEGILNVLYRNATLKPVRSLSRVTIFTGQSPETWCEVRGPDSVRIHSSEGFESPNFGLYPRIGATMKRNTTDHRFTVVEADGGLATTIDVILDPPLTDAHTVYLAWNPEHGVTRLTWPEASASERPAGE